MCVKSLCVEHRRKGSKLDLQGSGDAWEAGIWKTHRKKIDHPTPLARSRATTQVATSTTVTNTWRSSHNQDSTPFIAVSRKTLNRAEWFFVAHVIFEKTICFRPSGNNKKPTHCLCSASYSTCYRKTWDSLWSDLCHYCFYPIRDWPTVGWTHEST